MHDGVELIKQYLIVEVLEGDWGACSSEPILICRTKHMAYSTRERLNTEWRNNHPDEPACDAPFDVVPVYYDNRV